MNICVFGAASNRIDDIYVLAGEQLGEELAKRGHNLVFGAGAHGLMGAVARGVHKMGGEIYGVIPTFFREKDIEVIYKECTKLTYTETMAERKATMENLADAFIILPGGMGTFEEFFQVLTLKQLGRHTKPIALYNINGYYNKMWDMLEEAMKHQFIRNDCRSLCFFSDSMESVIEYVENDERLERDVHDLKNG